MQGKYLRPLNKNTTKHVKRLLPTKSLRLWVVQQHCKDKKNKNNKKSQGFLGFFLCICILSFINPRAPETGALVPCPDNKKLRIGQGAERVGRRNL